MSSTPIPRTVRVDDARWAQVTAKARQERRTVSEVVRAALDLYANDALPLPPAPVIAVKVAADLSS